jgi:glycine hydroxymethyltransferase
MFQQCVQPEFREYAQAVVTNAKAMAAGLTRQGLELTTGGTDNHLMVIDIRPTGLRGRAVQAGFDEVGITVNANAFPGHGGTPYNPNGIRLGSPAVTSRGMGTDEMDEIAGLVARMLGGFEDPAVRAEVRDGSRALCRRFPLPYRGASTA